MAHDAALPIFTGHRIGTAEVESALVLNNKCAEAAVVGYEHPIKGQGIYAYVTLMDQVDPEDSVKKELVQCAAPHSLASSSMLLLVLHAVLLCSCCASAVQWQALLQRPVLPPVLQRAWIWANPAASAHHTWHRLYVLIVR